MHGPEHVVEFFHGYTYSAHPLAVAAGLAALDLYRDEGLFERAKKIEPALVRRLHDAEGPAATCSTSAASASPSASIWRRSPTRVGKRGFEAMERGFHDEGIMLRAVGDSLAMSPPLIVSENADRRDFREDRAGDQGGG